MGQKPIMLEHNGEERSIAAWARMIGMAPQTLCDRVRRGDLSDLDSGRLYGAAPVAFVDADTPYVRDRRCQRIVRHFSDGLPFEFVGELVGVTRSRAQQLEVLAVRKCWIGLRLIELMGEPAAMKLLRKLTGRGIGRYELALQDQTRRARLKETA